MGLTRLLAGLAPVLEKTMFPGIILLIIYRIQNEVDYEFKF